MTANMLENSKISPIFILRGLQGLLSIVTLGLLAHVAQWYNSNAISQSQTTPSTSVPNEVAFAIFVSVWTLLITLPYTLLTPRFFPHLFKTLTKYTILVLECLSMILWFAAFVAVAAFLGKLSVCRGDVCNAAKAGTGIAAISWLTWGVTSLFALRFCLGLGASSEGISKAERKTEKFTRGLKLHRVWAGRGADEQQQHQEPQSAGGNGYPSRDQWESGQIQNRF